MQTAVFDVTAILDALDGPAGLHAKLVALGVADRESLPLPTIRGWKARGKISSVWVPAVMLALSRHKGLTATDFIVLTDDPLRPPKPAPKPEAPEGLPEGFF